LTEVRHTFANADEGSSRTSSSRQSRIDASKVCASSTPYIDRMVSAEEVDAVDEVERAEGEMD
jgi:hypothetical protein